MPGQARRSPTVIEAPAEEGLRERHKRTTRRALEHAALRLFARDGFDATTIVSIAAAAGVSPRTFFRYFASKDEVLSAGRELRQAQLRVEVRDLGADLGDLEAAVLALKAISGAFEGERESMLLRRRAAHTSPVLRGRMYDLLYSWQDTLAGALAERRGMSGVDLDVEVAAAAAIAVWQSAMSRWLADSGPAPGHSGLRAHLDAAFAVLGH